MRFYTHRVAMTTDYAVAYRGWMTRLAGLVAVLLAAVGVGAPLAPTPAAVPAGRKATNVAVITIHRPIDSVTAWSVGRRLQIAKDAGADAVVIDLDTPGGEVGAVLEICNLIKRSPIPNTVAWVNPNAYSGGAIIALACREMVVADYATLGDALPVQVSPLGMINEMSESERQKFLAPLLAEVVDSARRRGYDEKLVQGIVSRGVELWLVQNTQTGERLFVDRAEYKLLFGAEPGPGTPRVPSAPGGEPAPGTGPRPDAAPLPASAPPPVNAPAGGDRGAFVPASPALESLADQVDVSQELRSERPILTAQDRGKWTLVQFVSDGQGLIVLKTEDLKAYGLAVATVRNDEELGAFFGASNVRRLNESWSEGLVALLTNPIVRGVLIVVFLISLFLELTHPGLILPGATAAVALITLLAPPLLINMAAWWEVAAVIVGLLLIALELFVFPGFGLPGVAGLLLVFGGLIGTFVPDASQGLFPNTPESRTDLLYGVATVVMAVSTSGVGIYFIAKHFGSIPVLGNLVLKAPGQSDEELGDALLAAMVVDETAEARVGDLGVTLTPMKPAGKIEVGERVLSATADVGYIPSGVKVRVRSVAGGQIRVEEARGV